MLDSLHIKFSPQALDYVYSKLQACPWAEVNALLADIAAQVKAQQEAASELVGTATAIDTPTQ